MSNKMQSVLEKVISAVFGVFGLMLMIIYYPIKWLFEFLLTFIKNVLSGVYGKFVNLFVIIVFGAIVGFILQYIQKYK